MTSTIHLPIVPPAIFDKSVKAMAGPSGVLVAQAGLALMIFAGPLKGNPLIGGLAFDLTYVIGSLVTILAVMSLLTTNGKVCTQVLWMLVLFAGFALCGLWTQWTPYAIEKAERLFSITFLMAVLPSMVIHSVAQVKLFVGWLMIFGTVVSSGTLLEFGANVRATGLVGVTITLAVFAGMVLVGLYAYLAPEGGRMRWRSVFCLPFLFVIVASGSRGPLIFALAVIVFLTLRWSMRSMRAVAITVLLVAAASWTGAHYLSQLPSESVSRIEAFLQMQRDASVDERVRLGQAAIDAIPEHPFGLGIGGFGRVYSHDTESYRVYPHNLLLEIAIENGWLVAVFFAAMALAALSRAYRSAVIDAGLRPFFAILLFCLCETLVSGNLSDQRHVFCLVAIALQLPTLMAKQTPEFTS